MGLSSVARPLGIDEYLSDPVYERCEYVDGHPVELTVGGKTHGRIQIKCGRKLDEYFDSHPGGSVISELRCRLKVGGDTRFRLPDLSVVLDDDSPEEEVLNGAPDLVIEIRSPDDSVTSLVRKMDEYFANGAKLGWLVLPEEKSVLVLAPEGPVRTALEGEVLDGGSVLPDLKLPVSELFS